MAEVLIGQSYYLRFDPKLWQAMQPFPPLGSLYAASYLVGKGYDVSFFDSMLAESEMDWECALDQHRPAFAVIFEDNFNYLSKMCLTRMREAAFRMIKMARSRGCWIIICGADATDHSLEYLAQGAHFVLLGEGEVTLGELMDQLTGRISVRLDEIQGLAWVSAGVHKQTGRRPEIHELDTLSFPAWEMVDISRYREIWMRKHGVFALNMVTTRGCPYHCNWCAKPIWGQRFHSRSPQNVVVEMKKLIQKYNPGLFWFMDDIFGLKPGWVSEFADLIESENLAVRFRCLSRVDLLARSGEISNLKRAGAQTIWVGAESGSQKILDAMEKGTRVEQIYQTAQSLHAADIQIGFFLQFGYPGETRQDIEKTLQMVRDCKPDEIGISVSYPLPGTRFYNSVRDQLGLQQNWYDSGDLAMLYKGPFSTAYYRQLYKTVHCEFRTQKAKRTLTSARNALSFSRMFTLSKWFYYRGRLPAERWKLERLGIQKRDGLPELGGQMSTEEAAIPTAQAE